MGEHGKPVNRSLLISPDGEITARYDKIHMFDVDLGGGESYRESANYEPGRDAVIASLPWGQLGMTICYDLRFPHLHRALAQAGARFLAVPAAFTKPTESPTGTRCCALAPSNASATCLPPRRVEGTKMAAKHLVTAWLSRPGAKYWRRRTFSLSHIRRC